jgi:uncharacterized membrane protein YdcZ (DUF606 family)
MDAKKIAAIALVVAGVFALLYGTFSYTKETHSANLGGLELTVKDRESVNIPRWMGIAALVAGGLLLFVPSRRG